MGATRLVGQGQGGLCPNCSAPLESDAAFCIMCGMPVDQAMVQQSSPRVGDPATCAHCGAVLEPDAQFCIMCGTAVGQEPPSFAGTEPTFGGRDQSCPNCGWPLDPGAQYCISCGHPLRSGGFTSTDTAEPKDHSGFDTGVPGGGYTSGGVVPLIPSPINREDDDDAYARPRLIMLTREEARTGCHKTIEVDKVTHETIEVDVPGGVDVTTKLDAPGYGYFDETTGNRGPLRLSFYIS